MIIMVFIGCYFQNKTITRAVISSIIILAVSLLVVNPLYTLIIILPSLAIGIVGSILLKYKIKFLYFFIILLAVCFGLNVLMELGFVEFIIGMDLTQYILADDLFNTSEMLASLGSVLVFIYMVVIFIISLLQVFILYFINKIYIKKIMPLIGEKII